MYTSFRIQLQKSSPISQSATRQLVIKFTTYKLTSHVDLCTSEQLYYYIDRIDIKTSDFTSWSLACSVEKLPVERRTLLDIQDYI